MLVERDLQTASKDTWVSGLKESLSHAVFHRAVGIFKICAGSITAFSDFILH